MQISLKLSIFAFYYGKIMSSKLDNHIYCIICEFIIKYYKDYTQFTSFSGFCLHFKQLINNDNLNFNNTLVLTKVEDKLNKIFGLSTQQSMNYIVDFLLEDKYKEFEMEVLRTNELFKNCLN